MGSQIYWIELEATGKKKLLLQTIEHIKTLCIIKLIEKIREKLNLDFEELKEIHHVSVEGRITVGESERILEDFLNNIDKDVFKNALDQINTQLSDFIKQNNPSPLKIINFIREYLIHVNIDDPEAIFEDLSDFYIDNDISLDLDEYNYSGNFLTAYAIRGAWSGVLRENSLENVLDELIDEGDIIFIGKIFQEDEDMDNDENFRWLAFGLFKE
ncbi:MAG: hypothetical protein P8Y70_10835 [Candidatus Lokiarchaeota archaeon]